MNLKELNESNQKSVGKVAEFRAIYPVDVNRPHSKVFHEYKNSNRFIGFIEVEISGCKPFLMYSNNDDIVAMTFFWHGPNSYERKSLLEWVDRTESKTTILDIGAFSGLYSLAAVSSNRRSKNLHIYSFEPTRRVHARLLMNIQANSLDGQIIPMDYAISDKPGIVNFHQYRGSNVLGAGASFIEKSIPSVSSNEIVSCIPIDWFCTEQDIHPELVKIDVEWAEVLVLRGMQDVLRRDKPDVLIEVMQDTAKDVHAILEQHGYKVYIIHEDKDQLVPFDEGHCNKVVNLLAEAKT